MRPILTLLILLLAIEVPGQVLQSLKRAAADKAKSLASKDNLKKVGSKVGEALLKDMESARAEFDSADFDYALLLSDNSGLFDVREKGEGRARATSLYTLGSAAWKNAELTDEEKAEFSLQAGELAYGMQKFAFAEKNFSTARTTYEEAGLTEELGYLKTIANLGLLYCTMGRFTQAEGFTVEALDSRRRVFGDDNPGVAASLNNYGVLHYNLGRYNESEKTLAEAKKIVDQNGLKDAMPYAIVLNNEAMLFQAIGRYDEAVGRLQEAIAVAEKLQSSKSKNHLKFLSNLALLYQQMEKYDEAESIYMGMERRLGKNSPELASMLNNQAALYMTMGKEERVEELLKRSAEIFKSSLGEENPAYAKVTSDLGNFYRYKKRYSEAEPLLTRALAIRELSLGKNHPLYAQSQEDLGILYWKKGDWQNANTLYGDVMTKSLDFINRYFPPMSEAEKTKYWDVLQPRFQRYYNFALEASVGNPAILGDLYDYHVATKALLLNSTSKVRKAIFSSGDSQLIRDYVAWLDQKEQLARLYAYSKSELKEQKINLDSIGNAANAMEKRLSERSKDFSQGYTVSRITFHDIEAALSENEAVVEIVRIRHFADNFTGDSEYAAMIVTKGSKLPEVVKLENGAQLETRYSKFYRNAIQQKIADEYSYDQYWAPIEDALKGKKVIYVSPDGVFNQLNLNTLRRGDADYVINRYDLVILGNSKDLLALKAPGSRTQEKTATLLGFPDYGGAGIAALPGTRTEVEAVAAILKKSGFQVSQLMQQTASEANLKNVKAPSLIHIATHGYFLADVESHSSGFGVNLDNAGENPLLRSGLMLAGAARTVSGASTPDLESNDNGILTAYEAMNLNLDGTDLIVLSACETGLGEVKAGEGVYGLQRAFLVAGAEALIMSLWKVDDAATQQLMTSFYANWIKLGNKQKAFKQAQLQLMSKYKEPYYWGAFVMMGM